MEATQNVWHGNVQTSTDTLVPIESTVSSHPVDIALARSTRIRYDSETLDHVSVSFNVLQTPPSTYSSFISYRISPII